MSRAKTARAGFQFALPRGERRLVRVGRFAQCRFNSRSREGSDLHNGLDWRSWRGFNSRSREGSDIATVALGLHLLAVSIRAPARGATKRRLPF